MRNVLLSLIAAFAFALFTPHPPSQETPTLTSFDLALSVQNGADVAGFEFDILYNRAAAQITGITPNAFFGQSGQCNASAQRCGAGLGPAHKSDRSRVGAYSYGAAAGASGSGLLAVIHVQTSGTPDSLAFTIANPLVVDSQGKAITQSVTLILNRSSGGQLFLPQVQR